MKTNLFYIILQVIENLDGLTNLNSIFLGKNKITKLQNLDSLINLKILGVQVSCYVIRCCAGFDLFLWCTTRYYIFTLLPCPSMDYLLFSLEMPKFAIIKVFRSFEYKSQIRFSTPKHSASHVTLMTEDWDRE